MPDGHVAAALLVHGAGAGGWEWAIWRAVFEAEGIGTCAPDLMPSAAGIAATTLDDYGAQVAAAIATLPRPRVLVGASLGGLLAASHAESADALVLVDPLPPAPFHATLPRRGWPDVVPWRRHARLAGTRRTLPGADDASTLRAFRGWRNESGPVLRAATAGIQVPKPACPVLCIASGADADVPAEATRALAQAWNAALIEVPGASHAGPLFDPDAADVAARVVRWLRASAPAWA